MSIIKFKYTINVNKFSVCESINTNRGRCIKELGDWGSIPGLGKIFDPWICLNLSFPVDDYLSQD